MRTRRTQGRSGSERAGCCTETIAAVDDQAMARLVQYAWPGNIRELENAIERAVVLTAGSWITTDAILLGRMRTRSARVPSLNLRQNVEWIERETIRCALEMTSVKRHAARAMRITPRALAYYLNKYPGLAEKDRLVTRRISESEMQADDGGRLTLQSAE